MDFHIARLEDLEKERGPEYLARLEYKWGRKKSKEDDFKVGRDGDHLMVPFECDLCIFRKLKGVDPRVKSESDKELLEYIRRLNLDSMRRRATSTVEGNKNKAQKIIDISAEFELSGPLFVHKGPKRVMIIVGTRLLWKFSKLQRAKVRIQSHIYNLIPFTGFQLFLEII